jgi:Cu-Zn family superoxide dismutase
MQPKTIVFALLAGAACTLAAVSLQAQPPAREQPKGKLQGKMKMMMGPAVTKAIAVLHATKSGGEASGVVTFTKVANGVRVEAEIRGLTPGKHGFHIHEFGDCSSPDAMSAGGHFNPTKAEHAGPSEQHRHIGDLGNIEANARGIARVDLVDPHLRFAGPTSILGRGLIVHEKPDDLKTQPTGNAGGRVACGVIGVAKGS